MTKRFEKVLITGGAGYVGAVLIPKLLIKGYQVKVIDLYIYGEDTLNSVKGHPGLTEVKGDIRDREFLKREILGTDAIIHLACISNDPSYELDPELGKSINYDAFIPMVDIARQNKVKRFIFASSASIYGVKKELEVTEDLPPEPLTDYSKYKVECEKILLDAGTDDFVVTIVRPATICGYSPRLRLDLIVNILANHAINKGVITILGGEQMRPNIHIEDMTDLYVELLEEPDEKVKNKIYNVGHDNHTVRDIADIVKEVIGLNISIETTPTDDNRSYRVSSEKIKRELGFVPKYSIEQAVIDLKKAFDDGKILNPLEEKKYYNIRTMQDLNLK